MNTLHLCQRYLKQNGVRHAHSIHPPAYTAREVACAECMPLHDFAKVVVYSGDNGYGILVVPADQVADLNEVRKLLGLDEVRLATESELIRVFPECEAGAMPPFGNLFNMPVLVDEAVAAAQFMAFNAGTHRDVLRMSVADFHKLVNPLVASFAVKASNPAAIESRV